MDILFACVVAVFLLTGAFFALAAAIGICRLPDVYTRMHAASKAGTVGSSLMLIAVGFHAGDLSVMARALAGVLFFVLTAPVSAHLLAMAARKAGYPMCMQSVRDEMSRAGME